MAEASGVDSGRVTVNSAACTRRAANANFTTVRPHNFLDDRQAQPGAVFLAARPGRIGLVESLEDVRQGFRRNACAGICHIHLDFGTCPGRSRRAGRPGPQRDHASGRGVLQGIIHQVGEDLRQPVTVAHDGWQGWRIPPGWKRLRRAPAG